jgi:dUTP pyrophosphatase
MTIKIVNKSGFSDPHYVTAQSAGMDLRAYFDGAPDNYELILEPGERHVIGTGIFLELPDGLECQIRSRSGQSAKDGVIVLNAPGTIDPDYRGELKVILFNSGKFDYTVKSGDRIAQMVFAKYEHVRLDNVNELSETERGTGGFGSTGVK